MLDSRFIHCCRLTCGLTFAAVIGCSDKPSAVDVPPIEPTKAAEALLVEYDSNRDGQLSRDEFMRCPGLADAMNHYDENRDKLISRDELITRFAGWVESGLGVSSLACCVTLKGRPLVGAEIAFIPEDCFGGTIQPASGITDDSGTAMLSIDADYLPQDAHNMLGVQQGLYRIEITHPTEKIPVKYNAESQLGKEVSFELGENYIRLSL